MHRLDKNNNSAQESVLSKNSEKGPKNSLLAAAEGLYLIKHGHKKKIAKIMRLKGYIHKNHNFTNFAL
jgi:hypothetical protein